MAAKSTQAGESGGKTAPQWWFVDSRGRRIGYMWPEDMLAILESIWGARQGINNFARYVGMHKVAVSRWTRGENPIPKHIALLVLSMQKIMLDEKAHLKVHPWRCLPRVEADWLPKDMQDDTYEVVRNLYP